MSRRLRQRLDRLQAVAASTTMTPAAAVMLASCYARLHALFMPSRSNPQTWAAVRRLRSDYIAGVAGLSARATGQRDWVQGHDTRRELESLELAVAVRGQAETTGLILTPLGRATAFGLVWSVCPGVRLGSWFTERLRDLPADRLRDGEQWVSESTLFGFPCTGNSGDWMHWSDALLEPCVSGAVDTAADVQGRAYYRFVRPFEPLERVELEPSDQAIDAYVIAFKAELARLKTLEATDGEIVVPLSVSN